MADTVKLKNTGDLYQGYDEGRKASIYVQEGAVVEVSRQKADQLTADFPDQFEEVDGSEENDEKPKRKTRKAEK
jgi:hypothetical protein